MLMRASGTIANNAHTRAATLVTWGGPSEKVLSASRAMMSKITLSTRPQYIVMSPKRGHKSGTIVSEKAIAKMIELTIATWSKLVLVAMTL